MSCIVAESHSKLLTLIAAPYEDWIIQQAIALLEHRLFKAGPRLFSPAAVRDYLRLKLVAEPNEVFAVVFMDSSHRVLAYEPLFKGTIDQTTVYARVIVQRAGWRQLPCPACCLTTECYPTDGCRWCQVLPAGHAKAGMRP